MSFKVCLGIFLLAIQSLASEFRDPHRSNRIDFSSFPDAVQEAKDIFSPPETAITVKKESIILNGKNNGIYLIKVNYEHIPELASFVQSKLTLAPLKNFKWENYTRTPHKVILRNLNIYTGESVKFLVWLMKKKFLVSLEQTCSISTDAIVQFSELASDKVSISNKDIFAKLEDTMILRSKKEERKNQKIFNEAKKRLKEKGYALPDNVLNFSIELNKSSHIFRF